MLGACFSSAKPTYSNRNRNWRPRSCLLVSAARGPCRLSGCCTVSGNPSCRKRTGCGKRSSSARAIWLRCRPRSKSFSSSSLSSIRAKQRDGYHAVTLFDVRNGSFPRIASSPWGSLRPRSSPRSICSIHLHSSRTPLKVASASREQSSRSSSVENPVYSPLGEVSLDPRFHERQDLCDPHCTSPGLDREPDPVPCGPERDLQGAPLARLLKMPLLRARIGAQGPSHADLQAVVLSRFLDQGGELFFLAHRTDSYFDFFHTVATSHVLVARAPAL